MRKQLNKSDIKTINESIQQSTGVVEALSKKDRVELVEEKTYTVLVKDGKAIFFYHENHILPTIHFLLTHDLLPRCVVDMGAVTFVAKGADIMRPGIVSLDEHVPKDIYVVVVDKNNHKPLAVCKTLLDGATITASANGKMLKNIHYVGDMIWNAT